MFLPALPSNLARGVAAAVLAVALLTSSALADQSNVTLASCAAGDLAASASVQGATQNLAGSIIITNQSSAACTVQGIPAVQVLAANGAPLQVRQLNALPSPAAPAVALQPQQQASAFVSWSNFCQSPVPPGPYSLKIAMQFGGSLTVPLTGPPESSPLNITPPCGAPFAPSIIQVGPFQAFAAAPHDSRYFRQTGFRIDNDTIWDYFNRRGGVNTFGYPISRTFLFQGFTVQFFQRRIVQLDASGHARLLNVLDPGLMPYTSFNGALFPSFDSSLVASVPSPTDVVGALAWIQAHAPDSFQGLPVNFYQTFVNTVSASVAFPNGGDTSLLAGFDLEMWGIPTSSPQFDPNNHDFVYLRFQRGIMHYDAGCNCTRGILLADYLKSVLTGNNLPADLDLEARGSPFYKQYDPSAPNWVHNSSLLPATDLTNAFTRE